jgi:hypothetical protein
MKRALKWIGIVLGVVLAGVGGFVAFDVVSFNRSMAKVYDIPPSPIVRSSDQAVLARGKHLAESIGGCAASDCHGTDLGGGKEMKMGPLGTVYAPNITPAGVAGQYSDGEIARLILHGVKKDGRSVTFMASNDINWWPDSDIQAVISYLRVVPPVTRPQGKMKLGVLAKVLDRRGKLPLDIARRIDHQQRVVAPDPAPTAAYGAYVGRLCLGCHGESLSGGRIPGAPASLPTPSNITFHDTGLKGWTYSDFEKLLDQGMRKNGKKLDPFMPVEALSKMNEVERKALWAYLEAVPQRPFGGR